MIKRALVTGSTGALGVVLVDCLRKMPADFIVMTAGRSGAEYPIHLSDKNQVARAVKQANPDIIFHLAATYTDAFEESYCVNVLAARNILEVVQRASKPIRVVLIGSAAEYGAVSKQENPIKEERTLKPLSTYGLTKAWQTQLGIMYFSSGVDVVIARVFNLTGQNLSEKLFVGRLYQQIDEIHRGERSAIEVGRLSAFRDYISIDDAVIQLLAIAESGRAGEVYHVASGKPVAMRDLLSQVLSIHGLDFSLVQEGQGFSSRKGYDVPLIYADVSKTRSLSFDWEINAKH